MSKTYHDVNVKKIIFWGDIERRILNFRDLFLEKIVEKIP